MVAASVLHVIGGWLSTFTNMGPPIPGQLTCCGAHKGCVVFSDCTIVGLWGRPSLLSVTARCARGHLSFGTTGAAGQSDRAVTASETRLCVWDATDD